MPDLEQDLPPYAVRDLLARPSPERIRPICRASGSQVNATPRIVYLGYVLKILQPYVGA
jgi:hypothetical protein